MNRVKNGFCAVLLICLTFACDVSFAEHTDKVILQITGKIKNFNSKDGKSYDFRLGDLQKMTSKTVHATSRYVAPPYAFSGPLLREVLNIAGIQDGAKDLIFVAADNYIVRTKVADAYNYDVIVATTVNGESLTYETKGPLWSVYPIDENPNELMKDVTYAKIVWSLVKIRVQ